MQRIKRTGYLLAMAVLTLSTLFTVGFTSVANAASGSDTCTWTGSGTDSKFSTVANWSGCSSAAPVSGDSLTFDLDNIANNSTIQNDISNLSVNNIVYQYSGSNIPLLNLAGNSFTLLGNITGSTNYSVLTISNDIVLAGGSSVDHIINGSSHIALAGIISGAGNIVVNNGDLSLGSYATTQPNTFIGNITVNSNASLANSSRISQIYGNSTNIINLNGTSDLQTSQDSRTILDIANTININSTSVWAINNSGNTTLSGSINLGNNATFATGGGLLKLTGPLAGSFTISLFQGDSGSLIVASSHNTSKTPNSTYKPQQAIYTQTGDYPTSNVTVNSNTKVLVDGTYGDAIVYTGGVLGGNGTVGNLTVDNGGTVSPGHSPGCLTTRNETWDTGSIYTAEIAGTTVCSQYDQLKANGTINLGNATLDLNLLNGYKPTAGSKFVIISNDGKDKVTGTFKNLKEGATIKINDVVFKISYKGGDGNDVVLTVLSAPTTPDTGFAMITTNPAITAITTILSAGAIALIAKKTKLTGAKR